MTKEEFSGHIWDIVNEPSAILIDQLWADIEAERGYKIGQTVQARDVNAPEGKEVWLEAVICANHKNSLSQWQKPENVRPAPKYRDLTLREKATRLHALPSEAMSAELLSALKDSTIDDLCAAAGIETRVVVK